MATPRPRASPWNGKAGRGQKGPILPPVSDPFLWSQGGKWSFSRELTDFIQRTTCYVEFISLLWNVEITCGKRILGLVDEVIFLKN